MTTKVPIELSSTPGIVDGSNATAITIDSSENVGIGVTPDSEPRLHVHKASAGSVASATNSVLTLENSTTAILQFLTPNSASAQIRFGDPEDTGAGYIQYGHSDNSLQFSANGPEKMRINSSGYVGIGTSSPATGLSLVGANNAASTLTLTNTAPSPDNTWTFTPQYNSGSLTISDDGTQRMEINSVGQITMGSTSHADDILYLSRTGAGKIIRFYKDGSEVGYIGTENAHTSVPSDRDFKKDISDLTLGLDFVKSLNPKTYRHKVTDSNEPLSLGLIAQEVEASLTSFGVVKNSTSIVQHTPTEDEKQSNYWMNNESLIPVLIKGMKEQQTIIDDLKARIKTLEDA